MLLRYIFFLYLHLPVLVARNISLSRQTYPSAPASISGQMTSRMPSVQTLSSPQSSAPIGERLVKVYGRQLMLGRYIVRPRTAWSESPQPQSPRIKQEGVKMPACSPWEQLTTPDKEEEWREHKQNLIRQTLNKDPTKMGRVRDALEKGLPTRAVDRLLFDRDIICRLTGWTALQWAEDDLRCMYEHMGSSLPADLAPVRCYHASRASRRSPLVQTSSNTRAARPKRELSTQRRDLRRHPQQPRTFRPRRWHDVVYGCRGCNSVHEPRRLRQHLRTECPALQCPCGLRLRAKHLYERHRSICRAPFVCGTCCQPFYDRQVLYLHLTAARHSLVSSKPSRHSQANYAAETIRKTMEHTDIKMAVGSE
jgi:hypothetical protein